MTTEKVDQILDLHELPFSQCRLVQMQRADGRTDTAKITAVVLQLFVANMHKISSLYLQQSP